MLSLHDFFTESGIFFVGNRRGRRCRRREVRHVLMKQINVEGFSNHSITTTDSKYLYISLQGIPGTSDDRYGHTQRA